MIKTRDIVCWVFFIIFSVTGVLNVFLVHPVPGVLYILFSLVYIPKTNVIFKKIFGFGVPYVIIILLGLGVLWATLAVGDLAEIFGL